MWYFTVKNKTTSATLKIASYLCKVGSPKVELEVSLRETQKAFLSRHNVINRG